MPHWTSAALPAVVCASLAASAGCHPKKRESQTRSGSDAASACPNDGPAWDRFKSDIFLTFSSSELGRSKKTALVRAHDELVSSGVLDSAEELMEHAKIARLFGHCVVKFPPKAACASNMSDLLAPLRNVTAESMRKTYLTTSDERGRDHRPLLPDRYLQENAKIIGLESVPPELKDPVFLDDLSKLDRIAPAIEGFRRANATKFDVLYYRTHNVVGTFDSLPVFGVEMEGRLAIKDRTPDPETGCMKYYQLTVPSPSEIARLKAQKADNFFPTQQYSVFAICAKPDEDPGIYAMGYWREYDLARRRFSEVRHAEHKIDCMKCHHDGYMEIVPLPEPGTPWDVKALVDPFRKRPPFLAGRKPPVWVTGTGASRRQTYHSDKYPPFGQKVDSTTGSRLLSMCTAKKGLSHASMEKVRNAMNCSTCHAKTRGAVTFPVEEVINGIRYEYDRNRDRETTKEMIRYYVKEVGTGMPPRGPALALDQAESDALIDCLMLQYFGALNGAGPMDDPTLWQSMADGSLDSETRSLMLGLWGSWLTTPEQACSNP
jgi:hypothetical protein